MKVFLSWSGERSKQVANLLSDWLRCVIQACRPWISTRDLDRGALWITEINNQLQDTVVGIICLTQENKSRPWILFEAGALAKGLPTARVCTLLIDLEPKDVEDPLAQFNHTFPDRESIYSLVRMLNSRLGEGNLTDGVLAQVFDTYWPRFESAFTGVLAHTEAKPPAEERKGEDILVEVLENTRAVNRRLARLEAREFASSGTNTVVNSEPLERYHEAINTLGLEETSKRLLRILGLDDEAISRGDPRPIYPIKPIV
ncbi:MAG: TIR domain-containing protein [Thermoanaerobaculia bacterium]|nr:TIR domain-containing protein [Thermoanaerobaculia bacterium]